MNSYPQEVKEYIINNYKGVGPKEMTERLNTIFGTSYERKYIAAWYKNHKLNSGLTGRYPKGHVPYSKGLHPPTKGRMAETQFKAGHKPANLCSIGDMKKRPGAGGYWFKKIGPKKTDWALAHRCIYEEAYGPIPEGYVVNILDGNKDNLSPDNLVAIPKEVNLQLNRKNLRTSNIELSKLGVAVAQLEVEAQKAEKEK